MRGDLIGALPTHAEPCANLGRPEEVPSKPCAQSGRDFRLLDVTHD